MIRDPIVHPVAIADLRPTQITVGMREVEAKRRAWKARAGSGGDAAPGTDQPTPEKDGSKKDGAKKASPDKAKPDKSAVDKAGEFLGKHMVPVIVGPKDRLYVIDHHHLTRALVEEGQETVIVTVVATLKRLEPDSFWFVMDAHNWMHPFDENGRRQDYDAIPKTVMGLVDDPFRSLAGELRLIGGYAKDTTPFSEFLWADFLRRRMKARDVTDHFDATLTQAMEMAKSEDASYLPGWCGPVAR